MPKLILASASPRRRELLKQSGFKFSVIPSNVDEESLCLTGEPGERAELSALLKAKDVAGRVGSGLVLGADTIVVLDSNIYGKPENNMHAYSMLKSLSGKKHYVITGIALIDAATGEYITAHEITQVHFIEIEEDELWEYINSGEPEGKAGAYAIQGKGALFIEKIEGCYSNVVGLPLVLLKKLLNKHNFK